MTVRALAVSALVCAALIAAATLFMDMSLGDAVLLAPVIVLTVGATIGIVALWVKIALDSLRRQRHPRRIVAGIVGALAALAVLSFFVTLPGAH